MESRQRPGILKSCTCVGPINKRCVLSTAALFRRQNILVVAMIILDSNREDYT
jgi:hypothetical protein